MHINTHALTLPQPVILIHMINPSQTATHTNTIRIHKCQMHIIHHYPNHTQMCSPAQRHIEKDLPLLTTTPTHTDSHTHTTHTHLPMETLANKHIHVLKHTNISSNIYTTVVFWNIPPHNHPPHTSTYIPVYTQIYISFPATTHIHPTHMLIYKHTCPSTLLPLGNEHALTHYLSPPTTTLHVHIHTCSHSLTPSFHLTSSQHTHRHNHHSIHL